MECPHCGKQIENGSKECKFCGMPVSSAKKSEYKEKTEKASDQQYCTSKVALLICGALFILIAVVALCVALLDTEVNSVLMLSLIFASVVNAILFFSLGDIAQKTHETNNKVKEIYNKIEQICNREEN
ncbi:MAG: hypothetical protein KHW87_05260 [Clostridiales bacterium]|nr:hypothetical protein [Clostridiales bacterium]